MIYKFCYYCQIKGKAPKQFKFILKKDINLNYKIIVNIIYLDKKPIFHVIDIATIFQVNRFLNSMLAKDIWKALP